MADLAGAPVLSTPAAHILEQQPFVELPHSDKRLSDEQLHVIYEIDRTVAEIRKGGYQRVALQFPDSMLADAPRVFRGIQNEMNTGLRSKVSAPIEPDTHGGEGLTPNVPTPLSLSILGDTSYAPCCIDEIAAEHANADLVVHYGRACLSDTARISALHIFTKRPLSGERGLINSFNQIYIDKTQKIILMADVMYQHHLSGLAEMLSESGYSNIFTTEVLHDPASLIPNRTIPAEIEDDSLNSREWRLFHVANPPEALLLILSSRLASVHIYPVEQGRSSAVDVIEASSRRALNRRYALLTSISTVPIFGILINTLSVRNYQDIADLVKKQIAAAGKKSYTFVVGKLNAAKVANFAEIGAWVVIGCWESSLIESKDFWKPLVTPFELSLALQDDQHRVWTGEWHSDFQRLLQEDERPLEEQPTTFDREPSKTYHNDQLPDGGELDGEPESEPPDYDLRRGAYVSNSRPMAKPTLQPNGKPSSSDSNSPANSLTVRMKGDLALIGGTPSPGAEFLQSKRSWRGLGSDIEIAYQEAGAVIEEGRSGIARGYNEERQGEKQGG